VEHELKMIMMVMMMMMMGHEYKWQTVGGNQCEGKGRNHDTEG
jgi:hypothetical protein